jgi:hypothetical protein
MTDRRLAPSIRVRQHAERPDLHAQPARLGAAAAHSVGWLLGPQAQARVAHPPAEKVELARALVSLLTKAGHARTPEAAVDVLLTAVSKLRIGMAVKDAQGSPGSRRTGRSSAIAPTGFCGSVMVDRPRARS